MVAVGRVEKSTWWVELAFENGCVRDYVARWCRAARHEIR
jgi:hypothetical protein